MEAGVTLSTSPSVRCAEFCAQRLSGLWSAQIHIFFLLLVPFLSLQTPGQTWLLQQFWCLMGSKRSELVWLPLYVESCCATDSSGLLATSARPPLLPPPSGSDLSWTTAVPSCIRRGHWPPARMKDLPQGLKQVSKRTNTGLSHLLELSTLNFTPSAERTGEKTNKTPAEKTRIVCARLSLQRERSKLQMGTLVKSTWRRGNLGTQTLH